MSSLRIWIVLSWIALPTVMFGGQPNEPSIGTSITTAGAALLAAAVGILIYGLLTIR